MAEPTAQQMLDEIEKVAVKGDFLEAERLRGQLLETHAMAIKEIVAAADIIDEQMAAQMDSSHTELWHELYDPLSQEERNCLFYTTKTAAVSENKLLFVQGKPNKRVFFIDSGEVTLFHKKDDERHLVGRLAKGDIVGEEALLDITFPTFSATCHTEVKLRYLERSSLAAWDERFPGLQDRLVDFCLRRSKTKTFQEKRVVEKRVHKRLPMNGRITAHILGADGGRTKNTFKGFVQDISRGGINFAIRCSKKETAQALLGRMLDLEMEEGVAPGVFRGRIVRVGFHLHNDYSVHIQLGEVLAGDVVEKMAAS